MTETEACLGEVGGSAVQACGDVRRGRRISDAFWDIRPSPLSAISDCIIGTRLAALARLIARNQTEYYTCH